MKKNLFLPIKIEEKKYETEIVWDINLADEPIEDWCLNLSLLNWDLIDSLSLTSSISPYKVYFSKSENVSASERAIAKLEQNKLYLELSENELEYWIHFFLIDYRDGMAEVDHIDLETKRIKGEPVVDVVLKRSHARSPLSPEELERKLGIKPS